MIKINWIIAAISLLLLGGATSEIERTINKESLTGNFSITLKRALWKLWEKEIVYQDLTIDLVCDRGQCSSEIWGYSPQFNKEIDHNGKLKIINNKNSLKLEANLNIKLHPWNPSVKNARYQIELIPDRHKLIGSYSGEFAERNLQGKVSGKISPIWPQTISNHKPIAPQEHPRLIFRREELAKLKQKARTPTGKIIIAQLKKQLQEKIYFDGYVPTGGYHAAGQCFLATISDDREAAAKGWELTSKSMATPGRRILEQAPIVAGVALAYDLCYSFWEREKIQKTTIWLANQAVNLVNGSSPSQGWNSNSWSNWNARARGASGLASLAILKEPNQFLPTQNKFIRNQEDLEKLSKISDRNIQRYLKTALGDRAFGTEGDLYTVEPWILSVIPFIQAARNVMGEDLASNSNVEWFLPHYVTRLVGERGKVTTPTYGRHRIAPGGYLFASGLGIVPDKFLPGVLWFYNRNFGLEGDRTFGIGAFFPHQAAYVLQAYREDLPVKNPAEVFDKVLVDERKGFYLFRDRFAGENDFVASIYGLREPLNASWSFEDVGSFRIWGLGGRWASPGPSQVERENENVLIVPKIKAWKSSEPIAFSSSQDGSGMVTMRTKGIVLKNRQPQAGIVNLRAFAADYSGLSGSPGLFVVVDDFITNVAAPEFAEKTWTMHTEEKVKIEEGGFLLEAKNGATMKGTFIAPTKVKISYRRTEKGGTILATGKGSFFVVMTVQKGAAPEVKIAGEDIGSIVQIGKRTIYFRDERIELVR